MLAIVTVFALKAQAATDNPQSKIETREWETIGEQEKSEIQDVEAQIKVLRDKFEPDIKSLKNKIKTTRQDFFTQIMALQDKKRGIFAKYRTMRNDILEKSHPGMKGFLEQQNKEWDALNDKFSKDIKTLFGQERSDADQLHVKYERRRKELYDRYDQGRKQLKERFKAERYKADQNQTIH
jgi:hypothetical protein